MLAGLFAVALQLGAAAASPTLTVRNATASASVPLVAAADGPLLRLDLLSSVIRVDVRHSSPDRYVATVGGVELQLEPGLPSVRVAGIVHPLASAPVVRDRRLFVPLQLVSEVLPSTVPNVRWDAARRELVVFSAVTRYGGRVAGDEHATAVSRRAGDDLEGQTARPPASLEHQVVRRASGRKLIVVDAGHGGPDKGMSGPIGGGPRVYEKNITLAVAKRLGAELEARGLDVVYTRTTDTLIALSDRGRIANRARGDLFISIHVNAANPGWEKPAAARGYETYFLAEARTEDARRVEQMENESVRFESAGRVSADDPLGFILSDMRQNEHLRESAELADLIQRRLGRVHPGPSRGVKQAGFRVLVTAFMPAVLVEIGFGTNPAEAEFISDPARQEQIAGAVADAAVEYLERYRRRVAGGDGR